MLTAASVMRALAGRMTRLARTIDIVGRVGEDQLGLLLRGVDSRGEALRIATWCKSPWSIRRSRPQAERSSCPSLVAFASARAGRRPGRTDPTSLGDHVERASRDDRRSTSGRRPPTDPRRRSRWTSFVSRISHGHLTPYAQPVVDLASGLAVGYRGLGPVAQPHVGEPEGRCVHRPDHDTPWRTRSTFTSPGRRPQSSCSLREVRRYASLRQCRGDSSRTSARSNTCQRSPARSSSMRPSASTARRPLLDHWTPALQGALQSLRARASPSCSAAPDRRNIKRPSR